MSSPIPCIHKANKNAPIVIEWSSCQCTVSLPFLDNTFPSACQCTASLPFFDNTFPSACQCTASLPFFDNTFPSACQCTASLPFFDSFPSPSLLQGQTFILGSGEGTNSPLQYGLLYSVAVVARIVLPPGEPGLWKSTIKWTNMRGLQLISFCFAIGQQILSFIRSQLPVKNHLVNYIFCADKRVFATLGTSQFTAGHNPSSTRASGFWAFLISVIVLLVLIPWVMMQNMRQKKKLLRFIKK